MNETDRAIREQLLGEVDMLWALGRDTVDIAERLKITESAALRLVQDARERRRTARELAHG